jgi:VanZ family protein
MLPWLWYVFIAASQSSEAGSLADSIFNWIFGAGRDDSVDHGAIHFILQKGYHVGLFAVFGYLLALTDASRSLWRCLALSVIGGVVAECLQLFAEGRSPQVSDALLNALTGAAVVVTVFNYRASK